MRKKKEKRKKIMFTLNNPQNSTPTPPPSANVSKATAKIILKVAQALDCFNTRCKQYTVLCTYIVNFDLGLRHVSVFISAHTGH